MKKRTLLMATSLLVALLVATTGTLAYLSDVDSDVNVMTLGNVDITQYENGDEGFAPNQPLYPAYYEGNTKPTTETGLIEKEVTVKNTGASDAYVRTIIGFEKGKLTSVEELKALIAIEFETEPTEWVVGEEYIYAVVTYPEAVLPGETTAASLVDLYMVNTAGNADVAQFGETYDIVVVSQAVQTTNFPDAETALDAAFGDAGEEALVNVTTVVTTDEELLAAIQNPSVTYIRVDGDLTYDWGGKSYENSDALLMSGKTIAGYDADASITFKGYGSANPITNVTLKDITVKDETVGDNEASWEHGYLEFVGLTANNVVFNCTIMLDGDCVLNNCELDNQQAEWYGVWVEGGNATIKNSTFTGTRAVKIHEAYGTDVSSVVVDNCTFTLSEKPGVVIGDLNANTAVTIKNSQFATQPGEKGMYIYETDTDEDTFSFSESNNKVMVTVKNNDELETAVKAGNTEIYLAAGSYVIPKACQGKTLTIVGSGADTKVAVTKVGTGGENCDYGFDGSNVTFENLTITTNSSTYIGYARMNGTYKNCTINGTYTLYGNSEFIDCTFNVTGDVYNIWTWGAPNATFTGCTFNCDGKSLLLYGTANTNLTVEDCTFNDNGTISGKAAIEIGNDYNKSYTLTVTNATVNGFDVNTNGISTGTTLWANKNSMTQEKLNVVVNGVEVY